MDHYDPDVLRGRIADVLTFYYPACRDDEFGGHVAQIDETTREVYDRETRHLVATCRFVQNFAIGHELGLFDWCRSATEHGYEFLESSHRQPDGGYAWVVDDSGAVDDRRSPYGHAFVLLAHAWASRLGIGGDLHRIDRLLGERFTEGNGLLGPTQDAEWRDREEYRGVNANMHACEAYIASYEATGEERFLTCAAKIAEAVTMELRDEDGRIWEHYDERWEPNYDYNRDDPAHQFRPWGFQPGHHAEWAKLLATLDRVSEKPWLIERGEELFEYALEGWDARRGGFCYTLDLADKPFLRDKYGWAVAEAIGAAAILYERTRRDRYRDWYERFWDYASDYLVAPGGNWYTRLDGDNNRVDVAGGPKVEPGYHPIGACYESIRSIRNE